MLTTSLHLSSRRSCGRCCQCWCASVGVCRADGETAGAPRSASLLPASSPRLCRSCGFLLDPFFFLLLLLLLLWLLLLLLWLLRGVFPALPPPLPKSGPSARCSVAGCWSFFSTPPPPPRPPLPRARSSENVQPPPWRAAPGRRLIVAAPPPRSCDGSAARRRRGTAPTKQNDRHERPASLPGAAAECLPFRLPLSLVCVKRYHEEIPTIRYKKTHTLTHGNTTAQPSRAQTTHDGPRPDYVMSPPPTKVKCSTWSCTAVGTTKNRTFLFHMIHDMIQRAGIATVAAVDAAAAPPQPSRWRRHNAGHSNKPLRGSSVRQRAVAAAPCAAPRESALLPCSDPAGRARARGGGGGLRGVAVLDRPALAPGLPVAACSPAASRQARVNRWPQGMRRGRGARARAGAGARGGGEGARGRGGKGLDGPGCPRSPTSRALYLRHRNPPPERGQISNQSRAARPCSI